MIQNNENPMATAETSEHSYHLEDGASCYNQLDQQWQTILNQYIEKGRGEISEQYCKSIKCYCSVFLFFLKNDSVFTETDISYRHIVRFIESCTVMTRKSKSQCLSAVKMFLQDLAKQKLCTYGLSLYIHFHLQNRPFLTPDMENILTDDILCITDESQLFPADEFLALIQTFDELLSEQGYSYVARRHANRTLLILYLFLDMHGLGYHPEIVCKWFEKGKETFQTGWKIARKALKMFDEYVKENGITMHNDQYRTTISDRIPLWCRPQLTAFLSLKSKEHMRQETIDNYRFSIARLCFFLKKKGFSSFANISAETLKEFNVDDKHHSTAGKNACNLRIKKFLIYLAEKGEIRSSMVYEALPSVAAKKERVVITLSQKELYEINCFNKKASTPDEFRDKAMLLLGLRMGLRASDITNLKLEDINWREPYIKFIQKKTENELVLPMPVEVGNAIFEYLTKGRPKSSERYVFLRHVAPYTKVGKGVCLDALHRVLPERFVPGSGFHVTRKTFSTALLRKGVKRQLIADLLGHTGMDNLKKYLSIDSERMKTCPPFFVRIGNINRRRTL